VQDVLAATEGGEVNDCPDCRLGNMRYREFEHTEPHGEHIEQKWYECDRCGFIDDPDTVVTGK
jgi:C4-type Zn-finger protein